MEYSSAAARTHSLINLISCKVGIFSPETISIDVKMDNVAKIDFLQVFFYNLEHHLTI